MYFKTQLDLDNYLKRLKNPENSKYWGLHIGPNGYSDDADLLSPDSQTNTEVDNKLQPEEKETPEAPAQEESQSTESENNPQEETPEGSEDEDQRGHHYYDVDGNYKWAKKAEIKNIGEEIDGSARQKRNQHRDWGTIDELVESKKGNVTRGDLEDLYPNGIKNLISETDKAYNHDLLLISLYLRGYPAKAPCEESATKYADFYVEVKELAEKAAQDRFSTTRADDMWVRVGSRIKEIIAHERHNNRGFDTKFSAALINYHNRMRRGGKFSPHTVARDNDNLVIEEILNEMPENDVAAFRYLFRSYAQGNKVDIPDNVKDKLIEIDKALAKGKKDLILSGRARVPSKKTSTLQTVKEDDFYKNVKLMRSNHDGGISDYKAAADTLTDKFRFRAVEWGNSVSDPERMNHLVNSATALSDLQKVLNIPAVRVSMGGQLGLTFGSRGKGRALATYSEKGKDKLLNFTREGGYGCLAHEWGHALSADIKVDGSDYYKFRDFKSEGDVPVELRPKYHMVNLRDRIRKSGILNRIVSDPKFYKMTSRSRSYWTDIEEVYARTFEKYIEKKLKNKGIQNTYLVAEVDSYLWPNESEVAELEPYFDQLIKSIGGNPDEIKKEL